MVSLIARDARMAIVFRETGNAIVEERPEETTDALVKFL